MANQYTGEAYMGVKPTEADFGATGLNALNIDMALKAADREIYKEQSRKAAEARKDLEANLKRFDELATGAMDLSPQAFDSQMLAVIMDKTQNEIADMRRELTNPNISLARKSEIMVKVGDMKNKAASYTNQMKSFQKFLESLQNVGKGGYDDVMNAGLIGDLGEAIMNAGKEGVVQIGDNAWSMGKNIQFSIQNGMAECTLFGRDGKIIASGSPSELQAKIGAKLKPYVGLDEMMASSGKLVGDSITRGFRRNADGTITNFETTNVADIRRKAGALFDDRYGNTYDTDPYMQKGAAIGRWSNVKEAREAFVDEVVRQANNNVKSYLEKDPTFSLGGGSGALKEQKKLANLDIIQRIMNGDKSVYPAVIGTKSVAYIPYQGQNRNAQLENITVSPDKTVLHLVGETKYAKNHEDKGFNDRFQMSFDRTNPEDVQQLSLILKNYLNGGVPSDERLSNDDVLQNFNFTERPDVFNPVTDENGNIVRDEEGRPVFPETTESVKKSLEDLISKVEEPESGKAGGIVGADLIYKFFDQLNMTSDTFPFELDPDTKWYGSRILNFRDKDTKDQVLSIHLGRTNESAAKALRENMNNILYLTTLKGKARQNNPRFYQGPGTATRKNTSVMESILSV